MNPAIPLVDFSHFRNGSSDDRKRIASEIDNAFRTVGFLSLANHGIPLRNIEAYFERSKQFFALPEHEKDKLSPVPRSLQQGYFGVEKERIRGKLCVKENFDFGNPEDESLGSWPTETQLPGFRGFAAEFHRECSQLIDDLLECSSIALGLNSTEHLKQYHGGPLFVSSLIHYPPVSLQMMRMGQITRNPAHSDMSTLTLLFQRDVGGLQVADMSSTDQTSSSAVDESARFFDVEPTSETILVNVGYLLMRWTNGRWKNTVHRVSEPPSLVGRNASNDEGAELVPERYSMAFFSFPDAETVVEPFNCCCNEDSPKRWKPLDAGEYLRRKRGVLYS